MIEFKTKFASVAERPFRKPNCESDRISLFSAHFFILLFKTPVNIFEKQLTRVIPL